jgi:hypothetical protein
MTTCTYCHKISHTEAICFKNQPDLPKIDMNYESADVILIDAPNELSLAIYQQFTILSRVPLA